jgi:hypothetical protein
MVFAIVAIYIAAVVGFCCLWHYRILGAGQR